MILLSRRSAILLATLPTCLAAQSATRDSAGIRIYDYRAIDRPPVAFRIEATPAFLFTGKAEDNSMFGGVTALRRFADGRVMMALSATRRVSATGDTATGRGAPPLTITERLIEVRTYNAAGTLISRAGHYGTGPGELRAPIARIALFPGDSLALLVGRTPNAMVTLMDPRTGGMRTVPITGSGAPRTLGTLANGTVVAEFSRPHRISINDPLASVTMVVLDTFDVFFTAANGLPVTTLMAATKQPGLKPGINLPATLPIAGAVGGAGAGAGVDPASISRITVPTGGAFWPVTVAPPSGAHANSWWWFDQVAWELHINSVAGGSGAIVRPPIPLWNTRATFGQFVPRDSASVLAALVDDEGRYWIEAFNGSRSAASPAFGQEWWVYEANGALLGTVTTPAGLAVLHVGGGFVTGTVRLPSPTPPVVGVAVFRLTKA